jgi:ribosomal-protein-serine acetyltransferase
MDPIELKDDLITLRPYRMFDALEVLLAVEESMSSLRPYMPWAYPGYSIVDSEAWIKSSMKGWSEGSAFEFAIIDPKDGSYIGGCGLNHINKIDQVANLGYWVRSSRHGKGFASRAAKLIIEFGINDLKLNRIEILAAVENIASRRTAEKAGGVEEGTLRHRIALPDKVHDAVLFSIIPGDIGR